jgi:hypothetical protein
MMAAMVLIQERMGNLVNARTVRRAFRLYGEGKNDEAKSLLSPIPWRDFSGGVRANHRGSENGGTRRKKGKRAHHR